MKKAWQAPLLIILTRSEPEETVLTACKTEKGLGANPTALNTMCDVTCTACSGIVSS